MQNMTLPKDEVASHLASHPDDFSGICPVQEPLSSSIPTPG